MHTFLLSLLLTVSVTRCFKPLPPCSAPTMDCEPGAVSKKKSFLPYVFCQGFVSLQQKIQTNKQNQDSIPCTRLHFPFPYSSQTPTEICGLGGFQGSQYEAEVKRHLFVTQTWGTELTETGKERGMPMCGCGLLKGSLLGFYFLSFFLFFEDIFIFCVWVFPLHVCIAPCTCLAPTEVRGGCQVPWGWN